MALKLAKTLNAGRAHRAKQACKFHPFKLLKKEAFKMTDLKKDKTKVSLSESAIIQLLNDYGYTDEHAMFAELKKKLTARTFEIDYTGDFYDPPGDNMIWELSCMYNDIVKIKEHLLERQIQSLLGSLGKGFINMNDM